jgi:hypothetical protein
MLPAYFNSKALFISGISLVVGCDLPKVEARVRFPHPAHSERSERSGVRTVWDTVRRASKGLPAILKK